MELLSFREGREGMTGYLERLGVAPLRGYVPWSDLEPLARVEKGAFPEWMQRAEPDDDINYTLLSLLLLERHNTAFSTEDIARLWLMMLPAGATWTAERAAYATLLSRMDPEFVNGAPPGFDLSDCSDNEFNDWIGAQIRVDLLGWVCPGNPELAADLATRDASLSHRGDGVHGAQFIAALAACIPAASTMAEATEIALRTVPATSGVADAVLLALDLREADDAVDQLHESLGNLNPVHTLNNLAVVVWALNAFEGDFDAAVCNAVMAGWDTDCNGATVGGMMGLSGARISSRWTDPWRGRIATNIAGVDEISLDDATARTVAVANQISQAA